jgi:hypothetical protein
MHIATILSTVVVIVAAVRLAPDFFGGQKNDRSPPSVSEAYVYSFLSAVLFVNALAHFTHGISGEPFPGPYQFVVGPGLWNNLINVLWGFVNVVLGYGHFVRTEPLSSRANTIAFFCGVLAMGVFLSIVFTH